MSINPFQTNWQLYFRDVTWVHSTSQHLSICTCIKTLFFKWLWKVIMTWTLNWSESNCPKHKTVLNVWTPEQAIVMFCVMLEVQYFSTEFLATNNIKFVRLINQNIFFKIFLFDSLRKNSKFVNVKKKYKFFFIRIKNH